MVEHVALAHLRRSIDLKTGGVGDAPTINRPQKSIYLFPSQLTFDSSKAEPAVPVPVPVGQVTELINEAARLSLQFQTRTVDFRVDPLDLTANEFHGRWHLAPRGQMRVYKIFQISKVAALL